MSGRTSSAGTGSAHNISQRTLTRREDQDGLGKVAGIREERHEAAIRRECRCRMLNRGSRRVAWFRSRCDPSSEGNLYGFLRREFSVGHQCPGSLGHFQDIKLLGQLLQRPGLIQ